MHYIPPTSSQRIISYIVDPQLIERYTLHKYMLQLIDRIGLFKYTAAVKA